MPTLNHHTITIRRSPEDVFNYATTPAHWPKWHPSSLRLQGDTAHPTLGGAQFEEDIRAGGRTGHIQWRVAACEVGKVWVADAASSNGVTLRVTYRVSPAGEGTLFERTLSYSIQGLWLKILNVLILRRRIERESALSLQQLKAVMEKADALRPSNGQEYSIPPLAHCAP
ncbi:MAG: SRPBCC family protein [Pseudomonadota bacterium]